LSHIAFDILYAVQYRMKLLLPLLQALLEDLQTSGVYDAGNQIAPQGIWVVDEI
jgi:hypothetical protein